VQFRHAILYFAAAALFFDPSISKALDSNPDTLLGSDVPALPELPDAPEPQVEPAATGHRKGSLVDEVQLTEASLGKSDKERADEQLDAQVHQRVLGVVPMFTVTYLGEDTVSMTVKQKFILAVRSSTDPVDFVTPWFVAGLHEVLNDRKGFPWGVKGLGERAGAAYLDAVDGTMIGNAILPSILHQDPRYFRMGHGSVTRRLFYAMATSFICKHDKTGKWEPNYSNVGGNIASGAISTLYYPPTDDGVALTISNGLIVTATGAAGAIFNEFWPDLSRKWFHKDPTNGLDDKRRAVEEAKNSAAQSQL
jgi:hypothetical protein